MTWREPDEQSHFGRAILLGLALSVPLWAGIAWVAVKLWEAR